MLMLLVMVCGVCADGANPGGSLRRSSGKEVPQDSLRVPPMGAFYTVTSAFIRKLDFDYAPTDFSFPARKKRYFYHGWRKGNYVALSFDDGPNRHYTPPLLKVLQEKRVPATFFLIGENVRYYPQIVRQIIKSGCEVGNHSYTHPNLRNLPLDKIREQLETTQVEIKRACGVLPRVLRLPYGESSADVARIATEMRLDIFYWSIDTDDYMKKTTKADIVKRVLKHVRGGSIILMHDKSQKVVDAVREIIDPIRKKGLVFVTCSDLAARVRVEKFLSARSKQGK